MKTLLVNLVLAVLFSYMATGQQTANSMDEQRSFNIGHGRPVVKHPISLSDAELAVVRKATLGEPDWMHNKPAQVISIPKAMREGLEAAVVRLNGPAERDIVVIGSGRRYVSGNTALFWVIREEHGKPKVVLAVLTSDFEILPARHLGLAGLAVWGAQPGCTDFFDFDGDKYTYTGMNCD